MTRRQDDPPNAAAHNQAFHWSALLPLACCALWTACSDSPSAGSGTSHAFMPLALHGRSSPASAELVLVQSLKFTETLDAVSVEAAPYEVIKNAQGAGHALLCHPAKQTRIRFRGIFDPRTFNQLALHYQALGDRSLSVALFRKGKLICSRTDLQLEKMTEQQSLFFEFPELRRETKPLTEIRVIQRDARGDTLLFGLDLLHRAPRSLLPDLSHPEPVEIGLESRLAIGFSNQNPLHAESPVPPQAVLSFAFGQPSVFQWSSEEPVRLRLTLRQGTLEQRHEYPLPRVEAGHSPSWTVIRESLADFTDGHVEFHFELLGSESREELIALTTPILFTPMDEPPTVLFVTSDTHRADHLGATGLHPSLETPALDGLALRGLHFERAYSSTNATTPSHVALMTATHPRDTRVVTNVAGITEAATTLAECFHDSGYATFSAVSVGHLSHERSGLGQGFDCMLRPRREVLDAVDIVDGLQTWLPEARGRPLFVWLHVFDAHHPYAPPEDFDRLYWEETRDPFDPAREPFSLREGVQMQRAFPLDLHGLRDIDFPHAQYMAEITYLDQQLGRVFDWPRFSSGLIAMTADHGESFGSHDIWFSHGGAYPQSIHVPLILAGPGVPMGARTNSPVQHLDLGRTLLDLSELEGVAFPGTNLLMRIEEEHPAAIFSLAARGVEASITHRDYHLVLHLISRVSDGGGRITKACDTELYWLLEDPDCVQDQWGNDIHATIGTELRKQLVDWLRQARPAGWARDSGTLTSADVDDLAKLGYAAGAQLDPEHSWLERCDD